MVKVIIYFRKELDLESDEDVEKFKEYVANMINTKDFDEYYIFVGKDIQELEVKKSEILISEVKEVRHLKSEVAHLKLLFRKTMAVLQELRDIIYRKMKILE